MSKLGREKNLSFVFTQKLAEMPSVARGIKKKIFLGYYIDYNNNHYSVEIKSVLEPLHPFFSITEVIFDPKENR